MRRSSRWKIGRIGIDEPVADQRLEDVPPARPFARIGQTRRPEAVEFQLFIELAGEPARAPLPRPMQLHAEIEHLPLHHLAAGAALAFDNAPVTVLLAVLEASIRSQIHDEPNYAKQDI